MGWQDAPLGSWRHAVWASWPISVGLSAAYLAIVVPVLIWGR